MQQAKGNYDWLVPVTVTINENLQSIPSPKRYKTKLKYLQKQLERGNPRFDLVINFDLQSQLPPNKTPAIFAAAAEH